MNPSDTDDEKSEHVEQAGRRNAWENPESERED
jgi:hypothetical protein